MALRKLLVFGLLLLVCLSKVLTCSHHYFHLLLNIYSSTALFQALCHGVFWTILSYCLKILITMAFFAIKFSEYESDFNFFFVWCFVNLMQVSSDHEIEKEEDEEMHLTDKPVFFYFFPFSNGKCLNIT